MPDTPDLTPPAEQPMSDDARAHILRQLAAATAGDDSDQGAHRGAGRLGRWTAPAVAAAAVVAVVLGAFAVGAVREDSSGPGGDSLQPAAPSTGAPGTDSPTPTPAPPTATPVTEPPGTPLSTTVTAEPGPNNPSHTPPLPTTAPPTAPTTGAPGTDSPTPTTAAVPSTTFVSAAPTEPSTVGQGHGFPGLPNKPVSCDDEVGELAHQEPNLRGAAVTAQRDTDIGTIFLYETKTAWVVCDDSTAVTDGPQSERGYSPTLISYQLKSQDYKANTDTLAISENFLGTPANGSSYFFAAGRDFDGVEAISYKFPDGHTEDAVVGQNGLWSMSYLPTEGVLADPKTNTSQLDPITVTLQHEYDSYWSASLEWGLDTCAQLNHGC